MGLDRGFQKFETQDETVRIKMRGRSRLIPRRQSLGTHGYTHGNVEEEDGTEVP